MIPPNLIDAPALPFSATPDVPLNHWLQLVQLLLSPRMHGNLNSSPSISELRFVQLPPDSVRDHLVTTRAAYRFSAPCAAVFTPVTRTRGS